MEIIRSSRNISYNIFFNNYGIEYRKLCNNLYYMNANDRQQIEDLFYIYKLKNITKLDLSEMQMGPKDILRLERLLPKLPWVKSITRLDISSNRFSNDNLYKIANVVNTHTNLECLKLNRTNIGGICDIVGLLIRENKTLKEIHLENNLISLIDVEFLFESLEENTTLEYLNLTKNDITEESVHLICNYFKQNRHLKALSLAQNKILNRGFCSMATALENNTNISRLNMSRCEINFANHENGQFDKLLNRLVTLNIGSNSFSSNCLTFLAKNIKLNTCIQNLGLSNIVRFSQDLNVFNLVCTALANNNCLNTLDLSTNNIDNKMLDIFLIVVKENKSIAVLNLEGNLFDSNSLKTLLDLLKTNNVLQTIYIGRNKKLVSISDDLKSHEMFLRLVIANNTPQDI